MQQAFHQLGWEVVEITPACAPSTGTDAFRTARHLYRGLQSLVPPRLSSALRVRYTLRYDRHSRKIMERRIASERPDLVFEKYSSLQAGCAHAAARCRVPYVVQFHAPPEESPHFRTSNRTARLLKDRMLEVAEIAAVVTVVGDRVADYLVGIGVRKEKVLVLPNGVDLTRFQQRGRGDTVRRTLRIDADEVVVGFVGTVKPWQHCEILPEMLARVRRDVPKARFLLVGPFPNRKEEERFLRLARAQGVEKDFLLTGPVVFDSVPSYIEAMDICVLPDTADWGSPQKLFEYGACGRAVVMPRRRPIEEVVRNGENGLLFYPRSPQEMAERVVHLATHPDLRRELGERLRAEVYAGHTYDRNVGRILMRLGA